MDMDAKIHMVINQMASRFHLKLLFIFLQATQTPTEDKIHIEEEAKILLEVGILLGSNEALIKFRLKIHMEAGPP